MFPWQAGAVNGRNCNKEQNGFLLMARVGAGLGSVLLVGCFVGVFLTLVASSVCIL